MSASPLVAEAVSVLELALEVDYWGWFKSILFYVMLAICAAQTFYPILMIIAMFIRQLGFLAQYFHEVDEKSEQHGGEIIAQVLKAHGVEHIFTLGSRAGAANPICRGAEKSGIKVIATKHEVTAIAAADANSRVTGLPGIALICSAPGLTNTISAIKAAAKAESSLVLIGAASSPIMKEEHLEITNQMKTLKPLTKYTAKVTRVRDIAYELREALRQSLYGTPGPVYIQFNLDVLHPFPTVKKELDRKGTNWYLNYYIQNLFAAGFDVGREIRPWPIEIPFPKKDQIAKIVKAVTKAEKPLIIVGSQACLPPIEDSKIATILSDLGIPCFFEGSARGILARNSPLYLKHGLTEALGGCDLLLVLGLPGDFKVGRKVAAKTQVYYVNRNKTSLKANAASLGDHGVQIQSDVGQFLVEVSEKIGRFAISEEWLSAVKTKNLEDEKEARAANIAAAALDEVLPESSIVVSDCSEFANSLSPVLSSKGAWIESPSSAKLGAVAGYSLGVKLAKPELAVASLLDVSNLNYCLSEFKTCSAAGAGILNVVGNRGARVAVVDPSSGVSYSNLETAATEAGGKGITVALSDVRNLKPSFEQAVALVKEGHPVLVNLKM